MLGTLLKYLAPALVTNPHALMTTAAMTGIGTLLGGSKAAWPLLGPTLGTGLGAYYGLSPKQSETLGGIVGMGGAGASRESPLMPFAWGIGNAMNRASTDVLFKQDVPTIKGEDFRTDLSPEEYKKAMGEGWQKLGATLNLKNTPLEDYDDAKDDYFDFNLKSLPDVRFKATPRWIEQEVEKLVKGEGESAGTLQKVKNRRRIPGYDFKSTNIINGKEFGGYTNLSESQAKLFRETFANVLMPQTLWTYIGNK